MQKNWLLLKDCYWGKEVRGGKTSSLRLGSRSADSRYVGQLQLPIISLQQKLEKVKRAICNADISEKRQLSKSVFLILLEEEKEPIEQKIK